MIEVQEQMVETRVRKALTGVDVESENCRLCSLKRETVHWLSGCTVLAGSEYLQTHNKALMVFAVECAKEALIEENAVWYKITWQKGTVLGKQGKKLIWEFEYRMRKTTSARRPDLTLEDLDDQRKIWLVDMACPAESNIEEDIGLQWNPKKCSTIHVRKGVQVQDSLGIKIDESTVITSLKEGTQCKFLGVLENLKTEDVCDLVKPFVRFQSCNCLKSVRAPRHELPHVDAELAYHRAHENRQRSSQNHHRKWWKTLIEFNGHVISHQRERRKRDAVSGERV